MGKKNGMGHRRMGKIGKGGDQMKIVKGVRAVIGWKWKVRLVKNRLTTVLGKRNQI